MDEFKKINIPAVNSSPQNSDEPAKVLRRDMKTKKNLKRTGIIVGIILLVIVLLAAAGIFAVYFPAKKIMVSASAAYASVQEAAALAKKQDIMGAGDKLKDTRQKIETVRNDLKAFSWTSGLPYAGNYYADGNHVINAALNGVDAGQIIVEAIRPHADLLGLKGQGSFVGGSAEERIQKTVQTMDKITPKIDDVEVKLNLIKKELDAIDPKRYPEEYKGKKIRSQLTLARNLVDESSTAIANAKPLIVAIPKLLGEPKEKKYIVLFQNDKELRSTGGFLTAYAVFRMEHGKALAEASEDIYKLDSEVTKNVKAPRVLIDYLPDPYLKNPYLNIRDTNISPDYLTSMQSFSNLYDSVPGGVKYDGIIALDTHVLVKILDVLGPLEVSGLKFSSEINPNCNCTQVIYELERYADERVGYLKTDRKDVIGKLMYAIMQKALSSSPKLYWGRLFQVGIDEMSQKHILIYLKDENAQKGVEALNYGGRIREYSGGDYLHINDTNLGGAKSNMFVIENVNQTFEKNSDNTVTKTVTIKYNNPEPASNCNPETGKLCLNGKLRDWIRLYVPKGSQLIDKKGSQVKITTYEDLGKTVFDGFITVNPEGSAQVMFKYKLPFTVKDTPEMKMLIQKQPGTDNNKYTIDSGGKIQEFNLTTDKEVTVKL